MMIEATSEYHTTANGTITHFTTCGSASGNLVVCLHGLGGSTNTFTPLLDTLARQDRQIVCVDFEGLGKTPLSSPDVTLSIERYVSDLEDLLQARFKGKADNNLVIIGHSLGSMVAIHYAARHPDAVVGLGLLGVGRSASHIPEARQRMLDLGQKAREEGSVAVADIAAVSNFPKTGEVPSEHREAVRREVAASDAEGYARTCEAIVSLSHRDPDYAKIVCPTVFVSGEDDMLSPAQRARDLSALVGGKSKVFVVSGGHQPIISDLAGVQQAISEMFGMIDLRG